MMNFQTILGCLLNYLGDVPTVVCLMVAVLKLNVVKILIIVIMDVMTTTELQECIFVVDNVMKQFI